MGLFDFVAKIIEEAENTRLTNSFNKGKQFAKSILCSFNQGLAGKVFSAEFAYKNYAPEGVNKEAYMEGYKLGKKELLEEKELSLKKFSLTCKKCGKLAYPVMGTTRHYECACGNKFTGASHS